MVKQTFDDFLKQLPEEEQTEATNWEEARDQWLSSLERFYTDISTYLKKYTDQNRVQITYGTKAMSEERIGNYQAKSATIAIVGRVVHLEPFGTNIIGARGRVDLFGPGPHYRKFMFLLVNKDATSPKISTYASRANADNIELAWKIATPPPRIQYIPLDEDSFLNTLMKAVED